jgi:hypothetical protein
MIDKASAHVIWWLSHQGKPSLIRLLQSIAYRAETLLMDRLGPLI